MKKQLTALDKMNIRRNCLYIQKRTNAIIRMFDPRYGYHFNDVKRGIIKFFAECYEQHPSWAYEVIENTKKSLVVSIFTGVEMSFKLNEILLEKIVFENKVKNKVHINQL